MAGTGGVRVPYRVSVIVVLGVKYGGSVAWSWVSGLGRLGGKIALY